MKSLQIPRSTITTNIEKKTANMAMIPLSYPGAEAPASSGICELQICYQQPVPALASASLRPFMLTRVEASGVPAPRQCVSRLTA